MPESGSAAPAGRATAVAAVAAALALLASLANLYVTHARLSALEGRLRGLEGMVEGVGEDIERGLARWSSYTVEMVASYERPNWEAVGWSLREIREELEDVRGRLESVEAGLFYPYRGSDVGFDSVYSKLEDIEARLRAVEDELRRLRWGRS
jgi:hypothetical protein